MPEVNKEDVVEEPLGMVVVPEEAVPVERPVVFERVVELQSGP